GGMPAEDVGVRWEVAADPDFAAIVRRGSALAQPALAHSVHPEVTGLEPATEYWYRFRVGDHVSPVGRFVTLSAPGDQPDRFTVASASCQAWYHGHFTAHRHLAEEPELDLVVFLGDYIYEYAIVAGDNLWRQNVSVTPAEEVELETLEQYRLRYCSSVSSSDRKSTRLNSSHVKISYAVFCLKKKIACRCIQLLAQLTR